MNKQLKSYRILAVAGLSIFVLYVLTELLLRLFPGDFHIDIGLAGYTLFILFYILILIFFLLCVVFHKHISYQNFSSQLFYAIIILGILNSVLPVYFFIDWLHELIFPTRLSVFDKVLVSSFQYILPPDEGIRKILRSVADVLMDTMAVLTIVLTILTIVIKRKFRKL